MTYIGEYAKNHAELKHGRRSAKIILGDYDSWEEVLQSPILWGSVNFSMPDTIILKKDDRFPKQTENLTFFDEEECWTYIRVLNITQVECVTTSKKVWKDNNFRRWIVDSCKVYHYEDYTVWDMFTIGNQYIHAQYQRGQLTVTMNMGMPNREILYSQNIREGFDNDLSTEELKNLTNSFLDWGKVFEEELYKLKRQ